MAHSVVEACVLGAEVDVLFLELEDHGDAGEVEAGVEQYADAAQPGQGGLAP
jgi:hypothetical protein